jgi:hypothetical protein
MDKEEWLETHYEKHNLEVELPYGLAADCVLEVVCDDCGLYIGLNIWGPTKEIYVMKAGDGSCIEEEEE